MTHQQAIQLKAMIGILGSLYVIMGQSGSKFGERKALEHHQLVNDFITRLIDIDDEPLVAQPGVDIERRGTVLGINIVENSALPADKMYVQQFGHGMTPAALAAIAMYAEGIRLDAQQAALVKAIMDNLEG